MISFRLKLLVLFITIASVGAYCSVLVPPDEYYLAGFIALSIPFWLLIDVVLLFFLTLKRSVWAMAPLVGVLAAYPLFSKSFSFTSQAPPANHIRLMTYNTNALGYFRDSTKFNNNRKAFSEWVSGKDYDVYCFQEMVEVNKKPLDIEGYTRLSSLKTTKDGHHLGLFIYTKLPIVRHDKIEWAFNSYNRLLWADLVAGSDTIRVVNVHMVSYDFLYHSVRQNLLKVKNALKARSWHSKLIEQFIDESPYPVVLCGDFNELPQSYPYMKMNGILNDAFATSGAGYGYTYRFKGMPIRIDHVFTSDDLTSGNYKIIDEPLWSDHRPISVEIGRRDPDE